MSTEFLRAISMAATAGLAGFVVGVILGRLSANKGTDNGQKSSPEAFTGDGVELYVGNLSYDMTESQLKKAFAAHGNVQSVRIIKNKFNDRSKGYGFVEMADQSGANKAVKAMHGKEVMGRKLVVNEARSRSRD